MKFSLTISDLEANDINQIMNRITGETAEITNVEPMKTVVVESTPAALETPKTESTPAPAAMTAVEAPATNDVELDENGVPWDERIHSGNKKQTSKGVWQRRRGLQDSEFDAVMDELKAAQGIVDQAEEEIKPLTPAAPAAPVEAPTTPAAVVAPVTIQRDFAGLVSQINNLFKSGAIGPDYPNTIVERINTGFNSAIVTLTDVANDERMVDYAWQCLEVDGKAA